MALGVVARIMLTRRSQILLMLLVWASGCSRDLQEPVGLDITPVRAIGTLDGPAGTVFGEIRAVSMTPTGRLVVLDGLNNELRVFTADGEFQTALGREGSGPGEFTFPSDLEWLSDGSLLVRDVGNQRLAVYREQDDSLRHITDWRLEAPGPVLCVDGSEIFLLGPMEGHRIHHFRSTSDSLQYLSSMAPLEQEGLASDYEAIGHISCSPNSEHVTVATELLLQVQFFDRSTGSMTGEVTFEDHEPIQMSPTESGGLRLGLREDGPGYFHRISSLLPYQGGALVTLNRESMEGVDPERELWLVTPQGEQTRLGNLDFVPHQVDGRHLLGVRSEPFPQVVIAEISDPSS